VKRQRRQYSADWKAKVALEAIKGQRTVQEIASHYEVHPTLVTHWKKQLLEGAAEIFSNGRRAAADADEELRAELYQQIGKLQVEVDWLKKKSGLSR
jgi:transposase-like protein